jgi:uncharacterized protein YndB with AHSA1/START domain
MKAKAAPQTITVTVSRHFEAVPEKIFDAWLDPVQARRFLFKTPAGQMTRVDIDARVGGDFTIVERRGDADAEHTGEYLEILRPRRLIFTFAVPGFPATRVTIDIVESTGGGCDLTLTHGGVLPDYADPTRQGWTGILDGLERVAGP